MSEFPDLSHINLLISSPSGSGTWQDGYIDSRDQTIALLKQCGAKVEWHRAILSADIALTRAKLFTDFYNRKDFTHQFMIDEDMAWNAWDVVRMLQLDRSFLAAAGPKKKYPLEFAFNMWDKDGKNMPMHQESGTLVAINVPHVGGAFVLIKWEVAERLVASYPELEYDVSPGVVEYALFDPVILKDSKIRRRLSEDYAFCHRWRAIGGRVEMLTDVRLSHTGMHTFTGSVEEALVLAESQINVPNLTLIDGEDAEKTTR